jgi:hypothetical protein
MSAPRGKNACKPRCLLEHIVVVHRQCNYSAFNGYHWTPSAYSQVRCLKCGTFWRTKANYVRGLRDATHLETVRVI